MKAVKFLSILVGLLVLMILFVGKNESTEQEARVEAARKERIAEKEERMRKAQECGKVYDLLVASAKEQIAAKLKDPYTAKFEFVDMGVKDGKIQVRYVVQSRNGLGLYVTNRFYVNYNQLGDEDCAYYVNPIPTKIFKK